MLCAMRRHRILIVDDEPSITRMLKLVLERSLPVEVFPFQDARQALAWIESGEADPAVVICDLRMPGMDGLEFCRELKRLDFQAPVIILSAYASSEMGQETEGFGVKAFIQKPFIPKDFIELIRGFLPAGSPESEA